MTASFKMQWGEIGMTSWCSLITAALIAAIGIAAAEVFPVYGIWTVFAVIFAWTAYNRRQHRLARLRQCNAAAQPH